MYNDKQQQYVRCVCEVHDSESIFDHKDISARLVRVYRLDVQINGTGRHYGLGVLVQNG